MLTCQELDLSIEWQKLQIRDGYGKFYGLDKFTESTLISDLSTLRLDEHNGEGTKRNGSR